MTRLTETIKSFPHMTLTVIREASGRYRRGKYVPAVSIVGAVTFDPILDWAVLVGHELETGDGPFFFKTTDELPEPLEASSSAAMVGYYAIRLDDDRFQLAETRDLALAMSAINLITPGTGTHSVEAPFTFEIVAGVQAMTGREETDLPEGMSESETLVVYTESMLLPQTLDPNPGFQGDVIVLDWLGTGAAYWYVGKVEKYTAHYRAYISLGSGLLRSEESP